MDIIITLPSAIEWKYFLKDFSEIESGKNQFLFKVSKKPKNVKTGERCFLVHDGLIRGYWIIKEFKNTKFNDEFLEGFIIVPSSFYAIQPSPDMAGFRGFRYMTDEMKNEFVNQ